MVINKMFIKVKVFPCSKEQGIMEKQKDSFEIKVREKPVAGLANTAVYKVLASYFRIPEQKIRMIRGFKQRNKLFEIKID